MCSNIGDSLGAPALQTPRSYYSTQTFPKETVLTDDFDLIVIGAGSGGVAASRRAAAHGARVLIAEADRVGGTCVMRGCVPKKLMMYAAGFSRELHEAEGFGWTGVAGRFEMARWADAKEHELDRLEGIYRTMLAESGVELAPGRARLVAPDMVAVGHRKLRATRVLIATGATPAHGATPGLDLAMTSNEVLNLRQVPSSLLVVGGGYIAVEFASILAGLGAKVTLAFRDSAPLRGFDTDLRTRLAQSLADRGVVVAAGVALRSLERSASGYTLTRADGSVLGAEAALNATGRRPNTTGLGLEDIGVHLDARGAIAVDVDSRTTVPASGPSATSRIARTSRRWPSRRGARSPIPNSESCAPAWTTATSRALSSPTRRSRRLASRRPTPGSLGRWTCTNRISGR